MWVWRIGGMMPTGSKQIIPRKIGLSATFFTTNPTLTGLRNIPCLRGVRLANNRQRLKMFDCSALRNIFGHEK